VNAVAPEGFVYVCTACGKRSFDMYGAKPISYGWDVSCSMYATLYPTDKLVVVDGAVVEVKE
jgi:hypothetical protein